MNFPIPAPIETAPKDGTRILVFVPKASDPMDFPQNPEDCGWFSAWYEDDLREWKTGIREQYDGYSEIAEPSVWMPLPPDP